MDITVIGTAEASQAPDRATLHLTVTHEGPDRAAVVQRTTDLAKQVDTSVAALRDEDASSVVSSHLQALQTFSWRSYGEGVAAETMHRASVAIQVEFADAGALSAFGSQWALADGINLEHVDWALTPEHQRQLEDSTLVEAVSDARVRAAALAGAAGAGELEIIEVGDPGLLGGTEGSHGPVAKGMALMSSAYGGGGGPLDLSPQDIVVRTQVHVRFRSA